MTGAIITAVVNAIVLTTSSYQEVKTRAMQKICVEHREQIGRGAPMVVTLIGKLRVIALEGLRKLEAIETPAPLMEVDDASK